MKKMRWSEAPLPDSDHGGINHHTNNGNGNANGVGGASNNVSSQQQQQQQQQQPTTPQIKNHSVTYHRGYLYCFGGYDGRRNHQTLLIYSLREGRWMTPASNSSGALGGGGGANGLVGGGVSGSGRERYMVRGVPPPGRNGHTATLATTSRRRRNLRNRNRSAAAAAARRRNYLLNSTTTVGSDDANIIGNTTMGAGSNVSMAIDDGDDVSGGSSEGGGGSREERERTTTSGTQEEVKQAMAELTSAIDAMNDELETQHTTTTTTATNNKENSTKNNNHRNDNSQGGEIENNTFMSNNTTNHHHRNPNEEEDAETNNSSGNPMEEDVEQEQDDDDDDDEDAQIIIIGGWLGSGPLAASDMWVLDISGGLERLRWFQPPTLGNPPGPCNMHSADFIPSRGEVYVFRGGNGREYLNDLHALDVESYAWRAVQTHGTAPQQRANHSSALLDRSPHKSELFIFGGWNGSERLNDIHVLDTETSTWSTPRVMGVKPHPRAGMTLTALRGRLYLFGGSGTSSKCFDDLQVLDRKEMAWLDVNEEEEDSSSSSNHNNRGMQHPPFGAYYDNSWEMITEAANNNNHHNNNHHNHREASSSWEMLGGQDGMDDSNDGGGVGNNGNNRNGGSGIKFADWRSYNGGTMGGATMGGHHHPHHHGGVGGCIRSVANPNDEDMVPSVYVNGKPPGRRAGHTATAVGRHIYVFGGSCGTDYLNDFFVLDTDPPPIMKITEPPSPQLYASRLRHFYNDEEFSDVTFLVEGRKVFGHKLVLSTVSDCFRAMFMTGFRESGSEKTEIEIPNCSYRSFCTMMEYIYTGRGPRDINVYADEQHGHNSGLDEAISLLELADQFFLYNLKQIIEGILQPAVNGETYQFLLQIAQKTNASQLESYCRYFERNMEELIVV